jgi:hypothetical protein
MFLPRKQLVRAASWLTGVLLGLALEGCSGEPEPFRSKDPEKARAAILKRTADPGRPPGLPKRGSRSPR